MRDKSLYGIEKPGRYIGGEANAYRKSFDDAAVRFALAFPDVYEVGMSHLGLQLLYHTLNGMDDAMADRVYTPWLDFEQRLRSLGEPLRGIESGRPLAEFDFVGFSLQYELSYSNILTMLDLGNIPVESCDRTGDHPFVIAGGPCAFNPEPLADFFDFIVLGEAEEVLPELVSLFRKWRASGTGSRREFLQEVRKIEGIYVPSFFNVSYHPDGTVAAIDPVYADYPSVRKRLVLDLDEDAPIPENPLVPVLDIVHNRLGLEIARGCARGCRFCQAGFIYRPVRERRPQVLLEKAERTLRNSGFEELSLLSLSTGDYCQVQALLTALMDRYAREKIAVSFPSMRVGTLTPKLMELIHRVRKTGFTLAPEAGSERLRRVINKGIQDEDLMSAAGNAFQLGWRLLKLYFMTGLPTEEESDREALVDLCFRVWRLGKATRSSVNVSVSTFVPKPMTPFQWVAQIPKSEVERRLNDLKGRLKKPGMRLKWHHPAHSALEAVFARGDRRLGRTLLRAWRLGARFDGWTELFREDIWDRAFEETGVEPGFYSMRERPPEEIFPWDHLSAGVEKDYLRKEFEKALQEQFTTGCRWDRCTQCGACDHQTIKPSLHLDEEDLQYPKDEVRQQDGEDKVFLYRFRYSKLGGARFFGQLEIAQCFSRAVRRERLPAVQTKGFHPHIKMSFGDALPVGLETMVGEACISLSEEIAAEAVRLRLNEHLPPGISIEEVVQVEHKPEPFSAQKVTYRVSELSPFVTRSIVQNWRQRLSTVLVKKTKSGEARAQLGDVLLGIRLLSDSVIEMDLFESPSMCFRPNAILLHLLGEPPELLAECRICKTAISPCTGMEEKEDVRRAHHQL